MKRSELKVRKARGVPEAYKRSGAHKDKTKYNRSKEKREGWDG